MNSAGTPHIRQRGRNGRSKLTECGAEPTRNDVNASAWLEPFDKCDECKEAIRRRMVAYLDKP